MCKYFAQTRKMKIEGEREKREQRNRAEKRQMKCGNGKKVSICLSGGTAQNLVSRRAGRRRMRAGKQTERGDCADSAVWGSWGKPGRA